MKRFKLDKKRSVSIVSAALGLSLLVSGCSSKREAVIPQETNGNKIHNVTFQSGTERYTFQVAEGEKVYAPAVWWPEGQTLEGWYFDGEQFDFNRGIYYDIVLYSKFVPNDELKDEETTTLGR